MKVCTERVPELNEVRPGHFCACHLFDEALTEAEKELVPLNLAAAANAEA